MAICILFHPFHYTAYFDLHIYSRLTHGYKHKKSKCPAPALAQLTYLATYLAGVITLLLMQVFKPALPFAGVCLLASPWLPAWLDVALAVTTGMTCMSQQFHAWAHSKASQLPSAVMTLQVCACKEGGHVHCNKLKHCSAKP